MSALNDVVSKIDWELLMEQKDYAINEAANNRECEEIYLGIVHLIDAIQDAAVADGIATDAQVFGTREDRYGL